MTRYEAALLALSAWLAKARAPIEDETDPSKKNKGDDSDRPKLKRRPSDTGDNPSNGPTDNN